MLCKKSVDFYISVGRDRGLRTFLMRSKNVFDVWNDNMLSNLFLVLFIQAMCWTCGFV